LVAMTRSRLCRDTIATHSVLSQLLHPFMYNLQMCRPPCMSRAHVPEPTGRACTPRHNAHHRCVTTLGTSRHFTLLLVQRPKRTCPARAQPHLRCFARMVGRAIASAAHASSTLVPLYVHVPLRFLACQTTMCVISALCHHAHITPPAAPRVRFHTYTTCQLCVIARTPHL
jgi:hypothetical protein